MAKLGDIDADVNEVTIVATSTDHAVPRFDGTDGACQDSGVLIDDSDNMTVPGKLGINGATPPPLASALTAASGALLTTVTHDAVGTPDYDFSSGGVTNSSPFGFNTADAANTLLSAVADLQAQVANAKTRIAELEAMVDDGTGVGICAAAA